MIPAQFDYIAPRSLQEALQVLKSNEQEAKLLAGGHSLLPMMKLRLAQPEILVDMQHIRELSYVHQKENRIAIGAMTTYQQIEQSEIIKRYLSVLGHAAGLVGDVQVRNRGTIGGAVAHADPAADLPAVLLALDAEFKLDNIKRHRVMASNRFFKDAFLTALSENEILSEISIPILAKGTGASYLKLPNLASRFAIVGVATVISLGSDGLCERVSIAITGAGPKPARARVAEKYLIGKEPTARNVLNAANRSVRGIEFQDDYHASAEYRKYTTRVFTERALKESLAEAMLNTK